MKRFSLGSGERQVASTLAEIRPDHVHRYRWVADSIRPPVMVADLGCGCGYGSAILADAGAAVYAVDASDEAIEYAKIHWNRETITYAVQDFAIPKLPAVDIAVCFEVIEHLHEPDKLLKSIQAQTLFLSTVNQSVRKWKKTIPFHIRHYRKAELKLLLNECGWNIEELYGQNKGTQLVEFSTKCTRFIVVKCSRI